jgi:poly(A) polymerase
MPVITPAYPSMCATHNISKSNLEVIQREMKRGCGIMTSLFEGESKWHDLFQKHTFFTQDYKYYLSITAASPSKEAHKIWSGFVQSKVRRLVLAIDTCDTGVAIAHPFNKGFSRVHRCKTTEEKEEVKKGLTLKYQINETESEASDDTKDIKQHVQAQGESDLKMPVNGNEASLSGTDVANTDENSTIYTDSWYIGLQLSEKSMCSISPFRGLPNTDFTSHDRAQVTGHFATGSRIQAPMPRLGPI